jgi:hypothetical protein
VIDVSQALADFSLGKLIVECAKMKSVAWKYENEYRLITHPGACEDRTMPDSKQECFLAFDRRWVKTVDFGVHCPMDEKQWILHLLNAGYSHDVKCTEAIFHKSEYALKYKPIVKTSVGGLMTVDRNAAVKKPPGGRRSLQIRASVLLADYQINRNYTMSGFNEVVGASI